MLCDADGAAAPQPGVAPARRLYVDLRAAMLYAAEGDTLAFASRVIVGAPRTPTPETDTVLDHVRFRPTWRPTRRMVASGDYEDGVRPPGRSNPLGLAAVRFRDGGLVYLHGTNKPALFARDRRALSNGCVRVERLEQLVAWCLSWSEAEVLAAMNGRRTFDAPTHDIPLVMTRRTDHPALAALSGLTGTPDAG
jgi:murein L,D-transpeptidase YcbB/YkuD